MSGNRLTVPIVGGILCAIVGSLLGGVAVVLFRAWSLRSTESLTDAITFFPMAVAFAAIPATPFGFVMGFVGSWWLAIRAAHGVSAKRLYFESAGFGGALGSIFPLTLAAFGWGPFNNLISMLPISVTIGIACGI